MGEHQTPISLLADEQFRKGACHAGAWLLETARTLAAQGRTAAEVADHLSDLARVLEEWRAHQIELPDGNPWDWSFKDLADVLRGPKAP